MRKFATLNTNAKATYRCKIMRKANIWSSTICFEANSDAEANAIVDAILAAESHCIGYCFHRKVGRSWLIVNI